MGSTRLPEKVLRPIGHIPLIGHVLGRLTLSRHDVRIVVATSVHSQNQAIVNLCEALKVSCFRGSELDVLDRYYQCAKQYDFIHVVRLTADNPFTDIEELDRLIDQHVQQENSFTHSFGQLPIGVGAEIFSVESLEHSWRKGLEPHHREHVDEYMLENPETFKTSILTVPRSKIKPDLRLTVDTEEDWFRADALVKKTDSIWLNTEQIIELCSVFV